MESMAAHLDKIAELLRQVFPKSGIDVTPLSEGLNHCSVGVHLKSVDWGVWATEDAEEKGSINIWMMDHYSDSEQRHDGIHEICMFPYVNPQSVCDQLVKGVNAVIDRLETEEREWKKMEADIDKKNGYATPWSCVRDGSRAEDARQEIRRNE